MVADSHLKDLLSKPELKNTDKLLIVLGSDSGKPKTIARIREISKENGLKAIAKWNPSSLLSSSKSRAISSPSGWELTSDGRDYVRTLLGPLAASPAPSIATSLRVHLPSIADADARSFVEEGIECFEHRLFRSAVVLIWSGAIGVLRDVVIKKHLTAFNAEASKRDAKWRVAKTTDDLGRMKEYDFLQVIEKLSIVGKNVKDELEKQLKLRNGCGHPNTLKLSENVVAAHIETLVLNVFAKFR